MNSVFFLLFLLPHIAQSAPTPDIPLYVTPFQPTPAESSNATMSPLTLPSNGTQLATDEAPFLLPVPDSDLFPPSSTSQVASANTPLVMAYYPDWAASSFPPEKIDFNRFDWIDFAFALPAEDFSLTWDNPGAPKLLARLATAAHSKGKKVKLSVGGWTGSQ